MEKIQEWLYPLYKARDKKVYDFLVKLGIGKFKLDIKGTRKEISEFIKFLIVAQIMKKYRVFRDMVLKDIQKKKALDTPYLVARGSVLKIPKGIDKSWAIFKQDQRLCVLVDRLVRKKVSYVGTDKEVIEFIARFLLTQLLQDWRGPKMMVVIESLNTKQVQLKHLNCNLRCWDFTHIFK